MNESDPVKAMPSPVQDSADETAGETSQLLPARLLNEFTYCPRLFYYEHVEGVFAHNRETIEGELRHSRLDGKQDALPPPEELVEAARPVRSRSLMLSSDAPGVIAQKDRVEAAGHAVEGARDGPEGIARATRMVPALVLLDIQLPTMDGHAVARALRAIPALDAVPVVAVTSYAMGGDREQALAAGCDGYIVKPINPDTFVAQIADHLAGGRGEHGARP